MAYRATYDSIATELFGYFEGYSITQVNPPGRDHIPDVPESMIIGTDDDELVVLERVNTKVEMSVARELLKGKLEDAPNVGDLKVVWVNIGNVAFKGVDNGKFIKMRFLKTFRVDRALWLINGIVKGVTTTPYPK